MADFIRRRRRLRLARNIPLDRRIFRDRSNPLEMYSPEEVRERYRFSPESIVFICGLLHLERPTGRSQPLTPMLTTLVALHFLASNSHQIVIAAVHGVSRSSVSRAVSQFTDALCRLTDRFIKFPTNQPEIRRVQEEFYAVAGFPNVIGVIDCTHVRIQGPSNAEEDYVNRKNFHSLNIQMICTAQFRITNLVAKWPGSVHDARIFRESDIGAALERGDVGTGHLLGDSGYPCRVYLMTPYLHPQTRAQERFNNSLCRTRVIIEQTFGIIKRRFPCLAYGLRVSPLRAARIIVSCVILHNIGLDRHDTFTQYLENVEMPETENYDGLGTGNHIRDHLANTFFN